MINHRRLQRPEVEKRKALVLDKLPPLEEVLSS